MDVDTKKIYYCVPQFMHLQCQIYKNESLGPGPAVGGRRRLHGMGQKLFTKLKITR
jgi:hypothetical protein